MKETKGKRASPSPIPAQKILRELNEMMIDLEVIIEKMRRLIER